MQVLSINSHVCYGHVGAQAGLLPLQRMGHDVHHIPTVLFSNHPGHGGYGGGPVKLIRFDDLIDSLLARGLVDGCAALHSGYLGQGGTEEGVLRALAHLRARRPETIYLCDPVLGDDDRVYLPDAVVAAVRDRLVPAADVITPNRLELEILSGGAVAGLDAALAACRALRRRGPRRVVCTTAEIRDATLTLLAVDGAGAHAITVPHLPGAPYGTGDAFAAVLLGRLLSGHGFAEAAGLAAAAVHGMIRRSLDDGAVELAVVAAQEEVLAPTLKPHVRRLA